MLFKHYALVSVMLIEISICFFAKTGISLVRNRDNGEGGSRHFSVMPLLSKGLSNFFLDVDFRYSSRLIRQLMEIM